MKEKQQDLRARIIEYKIGLSNSAFNNKEAAMKRMLDGARELGFGEGQEQVVSQIDDILEGRE